MTPAIELLQSHQIPFTLHAYCHDSREKNFGDEAVRKLGLDPLHVFKTLMLVLDQDPKKMAVAVLPVAHQLDLKKVAHVLKVKKVEMADIILAQRTTGYLIGGISPLGQKKSLPVLIEIQAQCLEEMYISAGKRGLDLALTPSALARLIQADFADIVRAR